MCYYCLEIRDDDLSIDTYNSYDSEDMRDDDSDDTFHTRHREKRHILIGLILAYSDGVDVERGRLRGSTCSATVVLRDDEFVSNISQERRQTTVVGPNNRTIYSIRIKTTSGRTTLLERGTVQINERLHCQGPWLKKQWVPPDHIVNGVIFSSDGRSH